MLKRPDLDISMKSEDLKKYYYLKEELVFFCRQNGLCVTGSKTELISRIITFIDTGTKIKSSSTNKKNIDKEDITLDTIIGDNCCFSEKKREFYKIHIGKSFSFNVAFQRWLKSNSGKTYKDSIEAYYDILEAKKNSKSVIDKQFEYNTYIRDFFSDNADKTLDDAIKCWKYKKSIPGNHKYEKDDLKILR